MSAQDIPSAEVIPPAPQSLNILSGPIINPIVDAETIGPGGVIVGPASEVAIGGGVLPADIPAPSVDGVGWLPEWLDPTIWFAPVFWDGSFELGINGQEGNAQTFNLQTGFELSRETQYTNWDIDFLYAKNESGGVETQHNAILWSNWDYKLANPRWSWFNKILLEYDEFKQFDLRLALTTGLGYLFIDTPVTQLRGRAGLGTSREFGGLDEDWKPELNLGFDYARQLTQRQKLTLTVDYFPNVSDFSDFRVVADAGWEFLLDPDSNLSLKIGVLDRYDSTPGDAEENDVNYNILLIWTI